MNGTLVSAGKSEPDTGTPVGQNTKDQMQPKRHYRMRELTIFVSVVLSVVVFGLINPRFLGLGPARVILAGASTDGLMVIGMTIIIICGGFDLSIGSTMVAGALTSATLMESGASVPLAVVAGLVTGLVIGYVNGLIVTRLRVNPFITTLGTMSIIRGIVLVSTKSNPPTGFPHSFLQIAWGDVFGVPIPVLLMVVAIVTADIFLRRLKYLRQTYFVGSNENAAALSGINVDAVKTTAFVIMGVLAAAAGIIVASRGNAVDPNEGLGSELRVIAAVIVGGASLSGGRGTILGSFLGLLLMQIITTGLVFADVAPEAQLVAVGLVLIMAAAVDQAGTSMGKGLISFLTRTRSKKLERTLNVVLVIALIAVIASRFGGSGASVSGPASGKSGQKQHYVMVALATNLPYFIDHKNGLADKAKELGVETTFTGPTNVDVNQQIDAVNRAVAQRVDGIIAIPATDALSPAIDNAISHGIPVVCVDQDAPSSKRYSFIGTGNYNAGVMGGEYLAKALHGKGKIAILTVPGYEGVNQRVFGYRDVLKKYPGIQIVQEGNTMSSPAEGLKVARAMLQAYPDLAAFACVEAAGGQAAAVAVKEAGKIGKVKIVAMDRDEPTLRFIEDGIISASVGQRSYTMSYTALQMLYNIRNGQLKVVDGDWQNANVNPLPPHVDTGSFLITKSNVKCMYHK